MRVEVGDLEEKGAVARLETLAGEYVWDIEVAKTMQQQELEKLCVALGRVAQHLGLNHRIPGNRNPRDFSYSALFRQSRIMSGWQALAALCVETVVRWPSDGRFSEDDMNPVRWNLEQSHARGWILRDRPPFTLQ